MSGDNRRKAYTPFSTLLQFRRQNRFRLRPFGSNAYRGLVRMNPGADGARNYTQCDSLLMNDHCGAHTFPYIEVKNTTAKVEHEATTSKISDDQLFYCRRAST